MLQRTNISSGAPAGSPTICVTGLRGFPHVMGGIESHCEELLPRIKAEERVDENGRHRFEVEIRLPLLGRLVAYRGYLRV